MCKSNSLTQRFIRPSVRSRVHALTRDKRSSSCALLRSRVLPMCSAMLVLYRRKLRERPLVQPFFHSVTSRSRHRYRAITGAVTLVRYTSQCYVIRQVLNKFSMLLPFAKKRSLDSNRHPELWQLKHEHRYKRIPRVGRTTLARVTSTPSFPHRSPSFVSL